MSWETKNYSKLGKQGKVEKKVWKADGWALEQRIWSEFEFRFAIKKSFNGDPEPEKNSIFLLFYSLTLCVVSLLYTTTRAILRAIANAPSTCQKSKPWKFFLLLESLNQIWRWCVSLFLANRIRHRGPDWSGCFTTGNHILSHERLAIVGVGRWKSRLAIKGFARLSIFAFYCRYWRSTSCQRRWIFSFVRQRRNLQP